jgi:hypothetical protein
VSRYDEVKAATEAAFASPQVGDRFHEMYSFWMYVVDIEDDGHIVTAHGHSFPHEAEFRRFPSAVALREHWRYMLLASRGEDVTGWRAAARKVSDVVLETRVIP